MRRTLLQTVSTIVTHRASLGVVGIAAITAVAIAGLSRSSSADEPSSHLALAGEPMLLAQQDRAPAGREEPQPGGAAVKPEAPAEQPRETRTTPPPDARPQQQNDMGFGRWGIALDKNAKRSVRIESVSPSSPAARLLQAGDVVLSVDGASVRNGDDLDRHLSAIPQGRPVLIEVRRGGAVRFLGAQIPLPEGAETPRTDRTATLYPDIPAIPPPPAAQQQPRIVVVPSSGGGGGFFAGGGGGGDETLGARPPSFSAPGSPLIPGATFAPPPGTPATAYPQPNGVTQPPGLQIPLPPLSQPGEPGGPPFTGPVAGAAGEAGALPPTASGRGGIFGWQTGPTGMGSGVQTPEAGGGSGTAGTTGTPGGTGTFPGGTSPFPGAPSGTGFSGAGVGTPRAGGGAAGSAVGAPGGAIGGGAAPGGAAVGAPGGAAGAAGAAGGGR